MEPTIDASLQIASLQKKSCLVTGGAGFVGSHLVQTLLESGAQVTVLDDLSTGDVRRLDSFDPTRIEFVEGSVVDSSLTEKHCADKDYIFHLAARPSVEMSMQDPVGTNEVNVGGTVSVLNAARKNKKLKRFVYLSSSAVYGENQKLPLSENLAGKVISPYGLHKWIGEQNVQLFSYAFRVPGISLRPFNIYGPGQNPDSDYAAVIPRFISQALIGKPLKVFGDGDQTRDFIFITDMISAILKAATSDLKTFGEVFNVGSAQKNTIQDLAKLVIELTQSQALLEHAAPREGDIRHSYSDISAAKKVLSFEPKISLAEGLRHTIEWFESQ